MSPTMEEGGIVEWKVKEGQEFSSGDQLLDVETDKATIAVDALDDGIVWKILKPDGSKDVKVGSPIAVFADADDDLATLTMPELPGEAAAAPAEPAETPAVATPAPAEPAPAASKPASTFTAGKADPKQTFFPSVEILLLQNNISREDALEKIKATGPYGKILKGDVLAYLGKIPETDNTSIAAYIEQKSHLDLSHIELAEPVAAGTGATAASDATEAAATASPDAATAAAAAAPPPPAPTTVAYQYVLTSKVPEKVLAALVAKAAAKAETAAYASKNYEPSDLVDPLFEDLIAPPESAERFSVHYSINSAAPASEDDIIDEFDFEPYEDAKDSDVLTTVDLELVCNDKVYDSEDKAEVFAAKFGGYLSQIDHRFAASSE